MRKYERLLRLVKGYRGKNKKLSEMTGISEASLSRKLNGKSSMTVEELIGIVEALDIDRREIAEIL